MFTTFTNFTSTFTVPPFDRELDGGRPRAHSKAMSEMEKPTELNAGGAKSGVVDAAIISKIIFDQLDAKNTDDTDVVDIHTPSVLPAQSLQFVQ
ncbi:uncharacterized protein N0V89_010095 [Didymosphaeria variabile]|uniref:Uncharacterized protein n=1 Tax=Didymosphaeria variabile TaxID=1932322 RepID=A0A9W9C778_9PLEO|nr:uncharacterized protein N0V89_010095 [Didymosphaeria variabile]KAJ4348717.1 hypothetical protein N0V89_010095 [Didymosphaeria variabile]